MTPTFSIIIPVYNVAPYLRECLDSVFAQTYAGWEALCVDDGSNDGSGAILDEYAAKDKRFRVMHQKNAGVSAARNAALDMATGQWICFVDSDDIVSSTWLSKWYEFILKYPDTDAIFGMYVRFDERSKPVFPQCDNSEKQIFAPMSEENVGSLLDYKFLYNWLYAFRRTSIGKVRFERFVCGEDRLFTFDCLRNVKWLVMTNVFFYGYRERSQSYSNTGIRTYNGWLDELQYRICFLRKICELKFVPDLSRVDWLAGFLRYGYNRGLSAYSGEELKSLWQQYKKQLPVLKMCPALSVKDRKYYALLDFFPWYPIAKLSLLTRDDLKGCVPARVRRLYRKIRHRGEYANACAERFGGHI